jgi:hypothetical protein
MENMVLLRWINFVLNKKKTTLKAITDITESHLKILFNTLSNENRNQGDLKDLINEFSTGHKFDITKIENGNEEGKKNYLIKCIEIQTFILKIIEKFLIKSITYKEREGLDGLCQWVKDRLAFLKIEFEGYEEEKWKSGTYFCALVKSCFPELKLVFNLSNTKKNLEATYELLRRKGVLVLFDYKEMMEGSITGHCIMLFTSILYEHTRVKKPKKGEKFIVKKRFKTIENEMENILEDSKSNLENSNKKDMIKEYLLKEKPKIMKNMLFYEILMKNIEKNYNQNKEDKQTQKTFHNLIKKWEKIGKKMN